MDYFSIRTVTTNDIAEEEKQMATKLYYIAENVSSILGQLSGNSALKSNLRSDLNSAGESISAQQGNMARLSAALFEVTAEYEAVESEVCQCAISAPFILEQLLGVSESVTNIRTTKMSFEGGSGAFGGGGGGSRAGELKEENKEPEIWNTIKNAFRDDFFMELSVDAIEGIVVTAADGREKLMEIWNSDKSVDEMITEGFKVFNDTVLFPMKGTKTIGEWINQEKIDWPKEIEGTMDFIDKLDQGIDLYNAFKNYTVGLTTNDSEMAAKGAGGYVEFLVDVVKDTKIMKDLKKGYGFSPYNPVSLITDYGTNMVKNWMETIVQDGATTQEVYYQTFMHSALEVGMDCVYNKTAMAAAYYPLDTALGLVGVDLEGMYENVSDKKGIAAVMDATGELKDLILENSSWENWKNGMSVMGDYISDGCKSIGEGAKNLWNKIF